MNARKCTGAGQVDRQPMDFPALSEMYTLPNEEAAFGNKDGIDIPNSSFHDSKTLQPSVRLAETSLTLAKRQVANATGAISSEPQRSSYACKQSGTFRRQAFIG